MDRAVHPSPDAWVAPQPSTRNLMSAGLSRDEELLLCQYMQLVLELRRVEIGDVPSTQGLVEAALELRAVALTVVGQGHAQGYVAVEESYDDLLPEELGGPSEPTSDVPKLVAA